MVEGLGGILDGVTGSQGIEAVSDAGLDICHITRGEFYIYGFAGGNIGQAESDVSADDVEEFLAELVVVIPADHSRTHFEVGNITNENVTIGKDGQFTARRGNAGANFGAVGGLIGDEQRFDRCSPAKIAGRLHCLAEDFVSEHLFGLLFAELFVIRAELGIFDGENGSSQEGCIDGTGFADGQRAYRDSTRHLNH